MSFLLRLRSEISLPIMKELAPHYLQDSGKVLVTYCLFWCILYLSFNFTKVVVAFFQFLITSFTTVFELMFFFRKAFTCFLSWFYVIPLKIHAYQCVTYVLLAFYFVGEVRLLGRREKYFPNAVEALFFSVPDKWTD